MRMPSRPSWRWLETPVGDGLVIAGPRGVLRAAFSRPDGTGMPREEELLIETARVLGVVAVHDDASLAEMARRVEDWFDGGVRELEVPVDLGAAAGFAREVWEAIGRIPYGDTVSYGGIAAAAGRPRAARAVGTACAAIPVPLFLPVHRVVRADGTTGEPPGDAAVRRLLLAHEQAVLGRGASPWS